jgi:SAM-dependent methyltransferase
LDAPAGCVTTRVQIVTPRRRISEPQVGRDSGNRRTIESYEQIARAYAEETAPDQSGPAEFIAEGLHRLVDAVPTGGTALEVGSGPGWDADFVESQGVAVRRTDITAAFIDLQAERGKHVEKLDVISGELGGPYAGVMALAVLHHVDRDRIPALLGKVAAALHPGGVFLVAIREGDGELWEIGDSGNPYFTVLWRESAFLDLLEDVGLMVRWSSRSEDSEESHWLTFLARKES